MRLFGIGIPELLIILAVLVPIVITIIIVTVAMRVSRKKEPVAADVDMSSYPALENWKTSVLFSILGLVASLILIGILTVVIRLLIELYLGDTATLLRNTPYALSCASTFTAFIYNVVVIVYAAAFYSSYFKQNPRLVSSKAISFLNLFFGGVIFGCLWNHNLTRSKIAKTPLKGASATVLIVYNALMIPLFLINMISGVSQLDYIKDYYGSQMERVEQSRVDSSSKSSNTPAPDRSLKTTDGSHYYDEEYRIDFILPEGWNQIELDKTRSFVKWKAVPIDGYSSVIIYGAGDAGIPDYNVSDITQQELEGTISDILEDCTDESIEKTSVNNIDYWKISGSGYISSQGDLMLTSMTSYMTAKNGVMFMFQYMTLLSDEGSYDPGSDPYYDDYLELIASTNYDEV
ncbi:hypothetical protein AALA21_03575 [Eggerthellaceae bacterium 3-80]|nr:hypothetical protein D7W09_03625 [bacterium D16-34]